MPTAVRPGTILEVGDRFVFAGQVGPPLASKVMVQVTSPGGVVREINGQANLVWTAATALANHCGIAPHARISVKKGIPVSMGLGGGSSDAAASLVALNEMWELSLSHEYLAGIAD